MNSYRKESAGKHVIYTGNGAYSVGSKRKQASINPLLVIVLVVILVACISLLLSVSGVGAKSAGMTAHCQRVMNYPLVYNNGFTHPMCLPLAGLNDYKPDNDTESNVQADTVTIDKPSVNDDSKPDHDKKLGNPGNDKNVGHAGEHCNQNMCEQDDHGNKGKSN